MKRRIALLIVLMLCLCFAGCGSKKEPEAVETADVAEEKEVVEEKKEEPVSEQVEEVAEGFIDLGVDKSVISEIISNDFPVKDYYTEVFENYTADMYVSNGMKITFYTENEREFPSLVFFEPYYISDGFKSAEMCMNSVLKQLPNNYAVMSGSFKPVMGSVYVLSAKNTDLNYEDVETVFKWEDDFFSKDENCEFYENSSKTGKYKELYDYVTNYIETEEPKPYDNCYNIVGILEPLIPYMDSISAKYDSVEDESILYYTGIDEIGKTVHIVPIAYTNKSGIKIYIGFYNTDWIFFDKYIITTDDENIQSWTEDSQEDIIDSNTIYEYDYISLEPEAIKLIVDSKDPVIRFLNTETEKYVDFNITDDEKNALTIISNFNELDISRKLSNLRYYFVENRK